MKILHTADWHLGLKLGKHDLTERQFAQIERLANWCDEHAVDVLLVAGDVFEKRTGLAALTQRLAAILGPRMERGLHVVLVAGNHDEREHFRMMRALLDLGDAGERLVVVETRGNFELCGVQWGVLPYPDRDTLAQYCAEQNGISTAGAEARNQAISVVYAKTAAAIAAKFAPDKPAVFVAHVTVAGVKTPSDLELSYHQDIRIGGKDLPANAAYIALGHIHQAQQISGENVVPCYYAGNLDRFNRGERHDEKKGAYLVEIDATLGASARAQVRWLDLPVTTFHDVVIAANEIENLPQIYADLDAAFVHISLDCSECEDALGARRRAYELCPQLLEVRMTGDEVAEPSAPLAARDWQRTARDYVEERFAGRAELDALKTKTEGLIREVADVVA